MNNISECDSCPTISVLCMKSAVNEFKQVDKVFTLSIDFHSMNCGQLFIERSFDDFKALWRALKKRKLDFAGTLSEERIMPVGKFKKLMVADNWEVNGENWRCDMKRSLRDVTTWLNVAGKYEEDFSVFINEKMHSERKQKFIQKKIESARAKLLQQYLTSVPNIDLIILYTLEGETSMNSLYIEPSCGDGRVLLQVALQLQSVNSHIYGCDIDMNMICKTKALVSKHKLTNTYTICGNYINSTLADYVTTGLDNTTKYSKIVVFGNPPYTICSTDDDIDASINMIDDRDRDYILLFIVHSANIINAQKIVFIVPCRCNRIEYVEMVLGRINIHGRQWSSRSVPLVNSEFDLGTITVQQPSVLQIWERTK